MASQCRSTVLLVSCVLIGLLCLTNSSPFQRRVLYRRSQRLCGPALAEAVKFVCNGTYNGPDDSYVSSLDKRYMVAYDPRVPFPVWNLMLNPYGFSNMREASSMLSRSVRGKRQIVEECCKKSCSYNKLRQYCGNTEPSPSEGELMK